MTEKKVKTRLIIKETDEGIEAIIPSPRFNNPIAVIFTTIDVILVFPLSAIAFGIYYSEIFYKIALTIFSIPWVGLWLIINFVLLRLFTDRTLVNIDREKIYIHRKIKRANDSYTTIQLKNIVNLKIIKTDKRAVQNNVYPKLYIVTKKEEYSFYKFTSYIFTNKEVNLLANTIDKYICKGIVEQFAE